MGLSQEQTALSMVPAARQRDVPGRVCVGAASPGVSPSQPTRGCSLVTNSSMDRGPLDRTISRVQTETSANGIHMDEAVHPFLLDAIAFPAALM